MGPLRILLLIASFGLVLLAMNAWFSTRVPWLGFTLERCCLGNYVSVKAVNPAGPSQDLLISGTKLTALSDGRLSIPANNLWVINYPYELMSYEDLNRFVFQQAELNSLLIQPNLIAEFENGDQVSININGHRPITDLPLDFWLISFIGYMGFLISSGVWCLRRKEIAVRLFALSGVGFFLLALSVANFSSRQLVVNAGVLPYLLWGERIGDLLLAYSLCALLWYYPTTLTRISIASKAILLVALLGVNDAVQFYEFPFHAFMLPDFLIPFILSVVLAILQWRKSKNHPIERASLKWFLISFFLGSSTVLILEYLPPAIGAPAITPLWLEFAAIFIFYLGIALGISRYRLFDLDRWWLNMWLWLAGGSGVVALDIMFTSIFALQASSALWMAVAIVGWIYFPLRQWLWKYIVRDSQPAVETYLEQLNALFAFPAGNCEIDNHWRQLLQQVFKPLHIEVINEALMFSQLRQDGLVMAVPMLKAHNAAILTGRSLGLRLFNRDDRQLAEVLFKLARQNLHLQQAYLDSVQSERKRILRDLHDDVASPLMLLAHRAQTQEYRKLASSALMALREAVHGLQQPESSPLADVLADWRAEVRERLEAADVALHWEQSIMPEVTLTPHQRTNLGRVLREAVSNAINHASPQRVTIKCDIQSRCLRFLVADDGGGGDPQGWIKQTGLTNMETRIKEMGGEIAWQCHEQQGTNVEVLIPLGPLNASVHYSGLQE